MITLACLGHWQVQLLFAAPSLGGMVLMRRDSVRRRRKKAERSSDQS